MLSISSCRARRSADRMFTYRTQARLSLRSFHATFLSYPEHTKPAPVPSRPHFYHILPRLISPSYALHVLPLILLHVDPISVLPLLRHIAQIPRNTSVFGPLQPFCIEPIIVSWHSAGLSVNEECRLWRPRSSIPYARLDVLSPLPSSSTLIYIIQYTRSSPSTGHLLHFCIQITLQPILSPTVAFFSCKSPC